MEDSESNNYVAVEEVKASDYTPERIGDGTKIADKKIRVVLKSVTKPGTILPFKILDQNGTVLCTTLEEAFSRKKRVLFLQSDTILTQPDGCTVTNWA
jgi:hypothetical protein